MALSWPATPYTRTDLQDGEGNDFPQAAQINTPANEVVAMQPHFGVGTDCTANGGIKMTLKDSTVAIAYTDMRAVDDLAGVATEVIPDGTGDIATLAVVAVGVKPSSGRAWAGIVTIYNGDTEDIYNDGEGNQVTMTVNASGQATVVRATGTKTYDVGLNFLIVM